VSVSFVDCVELLAIIVGNVVGQFSFRQRQEFVTFQFLIPFLQSFEMPY